MRTLKRALDPHTTFSIPGGFSRCEPIYCRVKPGNDELWHSAHHTHNCHRPALDRATQYSETPELEP